MAVRTYKEKIEAARPRGMTEEEKMHAKNRRAHERRLAYKADRRAEAEDRNAIWRSMDADEKLKVLDLRLGIGIGAIKTRAKLAKQLEEQKEKILAEQSKPESKNTVPDDKTSGIHQSRRRRHDKRHK